MACEPIALTMLQTDRAFAASLLHGGQRVGGLAGLGDGQHHGPVVQDRVAVAELGADHHFHRDAGDLLDQIFSDHAGIGRGAAGGDVDPVDLPRQLLGQVQVGQADLAVGEIDAPGQGIGQGAHLLVDLLLHEVTVFALLGRDRIPGDACGSAA